MSRETNHELGPPPSPFSQLIIMLATSALQQMGKIVDPRIGKAEVSLEGAQATIDLLEMLGQKTRGNLDDEEERLLGSTLTSLRLNYVETINQGPGEPAAPVETPPPAPAAGEPGEPAPDAPASGEEKEPRFHKKYD